MKQVLTCLAVIVFAASACAQDTTNKATPVQSFKAGGVPIAFPVPTAEMVEVGDDNREIMEVFVPSSNRLLAAFMPVKDLSRFENGDETLLLSQYGLVQVSRKAEYMDIDASDFEDVLAGAKETFGDVMNSSAQEIEDEINQRLKALDLDSAKIDIDEPLLLGSFFSKPDAYGFGMITQYSMGGDVFEMACGTAFVRVKDRLLFVYLYAEYVDQDTVNWLRKTTEAWVDAILAANR